MNQGMKWLRRLAPLGGLLLANGCMATLERNVDYFLAPDALENTLFLPFSALAPWVMFVVNSYMSVS